MTEEIIATNQQPNEIECINKVELTGSVVHKYRPRNDVIILTIAVKGREIHEADYPNVAFYGENVVAAIDKSIVVEEGNYPRVRIDGIIQTTRKETDEGTRFYQSVVGQSIARAQTHMEQLTNKRGVGARKAESKNEVAVLGTLTNVYPIPKAGMDRPVGVILTVRTHVDGHTNFPRITCFNNQVSRALAMKPGTVVCATGFMETANRERPDGSRRRFESVIATEIVEVKD